MNLMTDVPTTGVRREKMRIAGEAIGGGMLTNPDVDLVTFTGGIPIGKYIAAHAVYKRLVLEMGGNDPLIVMEDADLDEAAALAVAGSYKNSGQRCETYSLPW